MEYDYDMQQGFEERMSTLYINPKIYLESYLNAFNKNGRIAQYIRNMSKEDFAVAQHIIKQNIQDKRYIICINSLHQILPIYTRNVSIVIT